MIKKLLVALLAVAMMFTVVGCSKEKTETVKLDPNNPVSLTVWHYYNGMQQEAFDTLCEEFNLSIGKEKGIYVKGYSQGSVSDLEKAINDAADGVVGAQDMPDIFSSYADTAYATAKKVGLADLSQYFTKDELNAYVDGYINEGYFYNDGALYLFPVAKSTEIMMVNKTDFEPFAEKYGVSLSDLETIEGVIEVAAKYYEYTDALTPEVENDGKAFYGRDSMANFFVIGTKQMGAEIFEVKDGNVTLNISEDLMRRLWDAYYVPYVKGYFGAFGKFRSEDVKTGDIIAYTGSTTSSMYFPDRVEGEDEAYTIEYAVCEAPIMANGEHYKVQQGAGMAVTKSTPEKEYAASIFLKWFTQKEKNLEFVCESAYLPVLKESNTIDALDKVIAEKNLTINPKAYDSLSNVMNGFENKKFYTSSCFENGYSSRSVLEYNMADKAKADRAEILNRAANGDTYADVVAEYTGDESFKNWYDAFQTALNAAVYK
ncbi:MAG: extracellular solute-binding protein [Erysipelotrichaceae bacterium]|nr:extracellular solute-binding protein [Erysipelotrichaceae bacterium]